MKKYFIFFAVVAGVVMLESCVKVPQAEVDAANAAIEQAKAAEANLYVEADYQALVECRYSRN
jgi:outer membrane murein-binding lipoprotein Lpp